jgi:hypothetical protein
MTYFDTDGDGHINFDEFLVGVRVRILVFLLLLLTVISIGKDERQEISYC